ncbi:MAG: type II toxin-antitoxin system RelE/ParE family toxin [Methylococcales bacterium]|nr:type II toxin-antitoxin system RelE/ParE family toxin [Methylococcales bacterium]
MNDEIEIILSPKAKQRFEEYADYLYQQTQSNSFVKKHLEKIESYLQNTLTLFPESGTPMPEYGEDIRRLSYQRSSILYKIENNKIKILTFYQQNKP